MSSGTDDPTRTSDKDDEPRSGPAPSGEPIDRGRFVPGVVIGDRYRIVSLLGTGGMGEVYRADDLKLRLSVALKLLPPGFAADAGRLARFHNEVRLARQVSHPGVCRVHDIGEVDGLHFLTMEYVDGEDLASLLRRIGRLPRDKALEVSRQICAGLAAAHDTGVLHRDLKPANVMIDGRGRARLTDFGLAVAVDDARARGEVAGTPAYMAPEQIEGGELSPRTDLYALGLVLYEVFTGHVAFKAPSVAEVLRLQREAAPAPPSRLVADLDPAVEQAILRCLEKDPGRRPASAQAVAVALLGANALEAAIAAGETPSPEMVAAAGSEAAWSPALAISVAVLAPLVFALDVAFHDRAALFQQIPWDRPPAVLADRGREVLKRLGYAEEPRDRAMGFAHDRRFLQYVEEHDASPARWEVLRAGQPAPVYFWYRESPDAFGPYDSNGIVTQADPPLSPGMASVRLDTRGRLLELTARPAEGGPPAAPAEPDWAAALAEAGLAPAALKRVEPLALPRVPVDARAAWEGVFPDQPRYPMRIEAGAYGARLVEFRVLGPWSAGRKQPRSAALGAMTPGVTAVILPVLVVGVVLARRNHRLGRGDRRGAFRVASFAFGCHMLYWVLRTPHSGSPPVEFQLLLDGLGRALRVAAELWVFYMALEPYVRRRWPETLVSWTRLLSGRFRDPLVGRDLMAGALLGNAVFGCLILGRVGIAWLGRPAPRLLELQLDLLLGPQRLAAAAFFCLALSVMLGMMFLLLLVLLRSVLRRQAAALAAFYSLWVIVPLLAFARSDTWPVELPVWAAFGGLLTVLVVRFGLLASSVAVFLGMQSIPVTLQLGAWYGQPALYAFALELGIAGFGLYACLAGRPLPWSRLLEE